MKKNLFIVYLITLWCIVLSEKVFSQDILWEKSLGGKHADYLFDAQPTADYGFILAGSSVSNKTGNKNESNRGDMDFWVWKMDEKGEFEWQKSMGGNAQDKLRVVLLTNDGGFLLAGSSESDEGLDKKDKSKGDTDFWIIKLNAKGGEVWQKTIGGTGHDELTVAIKTQDGGFLIGGSSDSEKSADKTTPNYGGMDYWVLKLDDNGKIEWQQSFGGNYADELHSITETKDGGFLLGGSSNSLDKGTKTQKNKGLADYWVIRLSKEGAELWQKVIGGSNDDQLNVVCYTKDGHFLLGGNSNSGTTEDKVSRNENGTDFWVLKLSDDQTIVWQQTYNIGKMDILSSLLENDDQTILIGGYTQGEKVVRKSPKTAKIGAAKSKQEEPVRMQKGTADYVAIKLNAKGDEIWRKEVGSAGEDILKKVITTRDGGYLMTGTSKGAASDDRKSSKGSNDFWVVKLKPEKKLKEAKPEIEAYPNPTTQFTNVIIGYEYLTGTCSVFDMGGRQLQSFPIAKERTIPVDLSGLPQGVYIVEIRTNVQKDGVKVLKGIAKN